MCSLLNCFHSYNSGAEISELEWKIQPTELTLSHWTELILSITGLNCYLSIKNWALINTYVIAYDLWFGGGFLVIVALVVLNKII